MLYDARDYARLRAGVLLSSAAAWVVMVAMPERSCHCATHAAGASLGQLFTSESIGSLASRWMVMLVAMMAPMTLPALYHIRISSFVRRRWRSSALFLTAYALVWVAAGGALTALGKMASWLSRGAWAPAVAVGLVAFVWQASPLKQRCLNRCHNHRPLAAFGIAADRDALLMGLDHGRFCVGSCWAIMLLPMLLPVGHMAAMAAVTTLMFCERLDPPRPPAWHLRGLRTSWRWLQMRLFGARESPPPYTAPFPTSNPAP